ncbi:MAG: DUF1598 domain-containing protein [Pirellulales bacterium]
MPPATAKPHVLLAMAMCLAVFSFIFAFATPATSDEPADPPASDAQFQQQLSAGQFDAALATAQAAQSPQQRDAQFARLAEAQARAGAREGSIASLGRIRDDRIRTQAMRDMAAARRGGGSQADFDALIELITTTVAVDNWAENGGLGTVREFEGGVVVDTDGTLARRLEQEQTIGGMLSRLRSSAAQDSGNDDVRRDSPLRRVSLTRLERAVQLRHAAGLPVTETMRMLAGMQRVQYVFVYPESRDVVIAGPAGRWEPDEEGRPIHPETRRPVVHLDDLAVMLRHMRERRDEKIGCSITPTREGLKRIQTFLAESTQHPLRPGQRQQWLDRLTETLGPQTIDVYGIDPSSRAARVLVEADYRMKLVGMGLEEGTLGVESYLDLIDVPPGGTPPPMDVLRWWFTMDYEAIKTTADRDAFALHGQGVRVRSENELLTDQGQRVHTGKSEQLNRQFAESFTRHFGELCRRYPVYADLQNQFDLAVVSALIASEDLPAQVGWHMSYLGDLKGYPVAKGAAPKQVRSVVGHREVRPGQIIAGVSGGVHLRPVCLVSRDAIQRDLYGKLKATRATGDVPPSPDVWWWD